ncbi:MAG TPA: CxxxxCH/CxxCH domain-containing protein [Anaeromyxobacter sp.]|nr:CxxxxCH/CxxCH domain-containing protein [Anaeromyxobacter sp.]
MDHAHCLRAARRLAAATAIALLASACDKTRPLEPSALSGCERCHVDTPVTGAHLAHVNPADPAWASYGSLAVLEDVSPSGGTAYYFGCGHCHPADLARHMDGSFDVDLSPPATPVPGDEIKARNDPTAAFDPTSGTCSNVYCHSSGQETPVYVTTPGWRTAVPGALGCSGCHGNPPKYPSGGPGAVDANSHVDLGYAQDPATSQWVDDCWEFGHFAGMPGATHPSKHGGGDPATWPAGSVASPITCQTCHFESVDASKVRAGGFFYFDPDGDYDLRDDRPGACATRGSFASWTSSQCVTCHGAELGGGGRASPLRHVNGTRDVAFDARRSVPAGYSSGIPALADPDPDPAIVLRPYFVFGVSSSVAAMAPAPDAVVRRTAGATPGTFGPPVLTATLESAAYDPASKTCSNVACHVAREALVQSRVMQPLRWGEPYAPETEPCTACHPM